MSAQGAALHPAARSVSAVISGGTPRRTGMGERTQPAIHIIERRMVEGGVPSLPGLLNCWRSMSSGKGCAEIVDQEVEDVAHALNCPS